MILSGDIHSSWAFEGPPSPEGQPVAVEMTIPPVASKPMGRSRIPGVWRLLDALARRLGHVPWVDVTERGYAVLEVRPEQARMEWWFVDPTADDASGSARLAKAYTTQRGVWPARLSEAGPASPDPVRSGLPEPLPDRPADLPRLRRRHRARGVMTGSAGAAVALLLRSLVRRRRPRGGADSVSGVRS